MVLNVAISNNFQRDKFITFYPIGEASAYNIYERSGRSWLHRFREKCVGLSPTLRSSVHQPTQNHIFGGFKTDKPN